MKKILNWLYGEDLNLKNKWWHRLLLIIFIFSYILFVIYSIGVYSVTDIFRGNIGTQQWRRVAVLSERITSEIMPIGGLINVGEKIAENDRTYYLNDQPDEYYKGIVNNVYCSTELATDYELIKDVKKIDELYLMELNRRNKVLPEVFLNYIKQNEIKCLVIDAYTYSDGSRVTFLEPDKSYQNDWSFYEKSPTKTLVYFLEMIFVVLIFSSLFFVGIMVFYYKIILYVIFGSKKK